MLRGLKEHIPLSELTTMRVGGPARYFYAAKNTKDIQNALRFAKSKHLPVFFLGEGSNIVVSDKGMDGLTLKADIAGIDIAEDEDDYIISCGAGEHWDTCVEKVVEQNIFGIENLSAIPGTVGAAPVQNIGAYGVELKDVIDFVEVIDSRSGELIRMNHDACLFSYRDSIFKKPEGKHLLVTGVSLRIPKNKKANLQYADVWKYVGERGIDTEELTPSDVRAGIIEIRARKLPDVKKIGTVGSFFKNPIVSKEKFNALSHIYRGLPGYAVSGDGMKIPLGWIVEHVCKKKGHRNKTVGVYEKQALVLVHYGGGTAQEIHEYANGLRGDIKRYTGIDAEFEISFVGEFDEKQ